jgi:hypothetical protein
MLHLYVRWLASGLGGLLVVLVALLSWWRVA